MKTFCLWVAIFMAAAGMGLAETAYWSDNFQTNAASRWSANSAGTWNFSSPTAGPPVNSLGYRSYDGTNCASTFGYSPASQDVRLVCTKYNGAKTLLVPAANQYPRLRFWQWYSYANALASVAISTNNGSNWIQISQTYEYTPYPTGGGVWSRPSFDLRAYAGQFVQISFDFQSGGCCGNGLG